MVMMIVMVYMDWYANFNWIWDVSLNVNGHMFLDMHWVGIIDWNLELTIRREIRLGLKLNEKSFESCGFALNHLVP